MSELADLAAEQGARALHGCDAALIQGGAVRGKAEYAKGAFTFGDLMREFAFECEMAVVELPGRVLAASRATRATARAPSRASCTPTTARGRGRRPVTLDAPSPARRSSPRSSTRSRSTNSFGGMNPIAPLDRLRAQSRFEVPEPSAASREEPRARDVREGGVAPRRRRDQRAGGDAAGAAGEGEGGARQRTAASASSTRRQRKISAAELTAAVKAIDEDDDPDNDVPVDLVAHA